MMQFQKRREVGVCNDEEVAHDDRTKSARTGSGREEKGRVGGVCVRRDWSSWGEVM